MSPYEILRLWWKRRQMWRHRTAWTWPRKKPLPAPEASTLRTPDWRRYELHTPRKYIP